MRILIGMSATAGLFHTCFPGIHLLRAESSQSHLITTKLYAHAVMPSFNGGVKD